MYYNLKISSHIWTTTSYMNYIITSHILYELHYHSPHLIWNREFADFNFLQRLLCMLYKRNSFKVNSKASTYRNTSSNYRNDSYQWVMHIINSINITNFNCIQRVKYIYWIIRSLFMKNKMIKVNTSLQYIYIFRNISLNA